MSLNRAFIIAATRVRIERFGSSWQIAVYEPKYNAWMHSYIGPYHQVISMRRHALIRTALELLGVEDANIEAYRLTKQSLGWREVVRAFMRKGSR